MWHYALIRIDPEIVLLAGVGLASLFSLWLAGSLAGQVFGDSRLRAAAAGPDGSGAAEEPPAPKSGRAGRRDSEILAVRANAQGGYLRYTDGSYGAAPGTCQVVAGCFYRGYFRKASYAATLSP